MPIEELAKQVVRGLTFERALGCEVRHGHRLLEWRHHGLGMLQAELSESLRIHVWHPTLVSPDMPWPRCVHDHRFDLQSMVVVGAVRDVCPDVRFVKGCDLADLRVATGRPHPSGYWIDAKVYEIEHAKEQDRLVVGGCSTTMSARYLGDVILTRTYADKTYKAGESYGVARRKFHTTEIDGLAVTVVHRCHFDDRLARVLSNSDVTALSGIVQNDSA